MALIANALRPKGDPKIVSSGRSSLYPEDRLAKSLGWFSIGLGLVEIFAARRVTRHLGAEGSEGIVRAFGIREIASGITTLSTEKQAGLAARVAGDAIDMAMLLRLFTPDNPQRGNVKGALATVACVSALDLLAAWAVHKRAKRKGPPKDYSDRSGLPRGVEASRRMRAQTSAQKSAATMDRSAT